MKKTPTIFERDWNGDRSLVTEESNPACLWVFAGEGVATRKIDGTCCMVRDGEIYKRRELRAGQEAPADFEMAAYDDETGKTIGWMPVTQHNEDRYHREAFGRRSNWEEGTYELIGPNIQGNPEHVEENMLVAHGAEGLAGPYGLPPRTFDGLKTWFAEHNVEGIVWHHPDGRMAKIKRRDFGLNREGTTK